MKTDDNKKTNENKIWFPAKKYGYGWGPPNTWQGWLVIALYVATCTTFSVALMPLHPVAWGLCMFTETAALLAICYAKGEKPGWRWGKD